MQGLRAAHYRREGLQCRADHIISRLLRRKGAAGGLRMKTESQRARVFGVEAFAHGVVPDAPRGAIFRQFLEEIVVRVEEERQSRREIVHGEAALHPALHILDPVAQRERQLLNRRRARLANVIPADGDGIEARRALCAKFQRVHYKTQ